MPYPPLRCQVLALPGDLYLIHIVKMEKFQCFEMALPSGNYTEQWIDTVTGKITKTETFTHKGAIHGCDPPEYDIDIALKIKRVKSK
jgi:hypothetical protein